MISLEIEHVTYRFVAYILLQTNTLRRAHSVKNGIGGEGMDGIHLAQNMGL
jgi:hypothetical protein